jgi:nitrate reductase gamma subunit
MADQITNKKTTNMLRSIIQNAKEKSLISTVVLLFSFLAFSSVSHAEGSAELFKTRCAVCHSTTDEVKIGPGLGGITDRRDGEWLMNWIKNSDELIKSGDADAIAIYEEYNKSAMPPFTDLSDGEVQGLIDYMADPTVVAGDDGAGETTSSTNDVDTAASRDLGSFLFWGILILVLLIAYFINYLRRVKRLSLEDGIFFDPHKGTNYARVFLVTIAIFGLVILMLIEGLNSNLSQINGILFATLPYLAFGIFIIGSIYRYTKKGYKVSSLSSQFLEGKKLFWGSQPFHWGMLVLFFGHIIAFLFPRALIAWNGQPIRLMILEISSFAFALLALLGLILLIKRRLMSKTLLVVSNKMDMVVYAILFTQVLSGIGVAFFVRWGSTWFASVLTPYLRSIFSFNPDIAAISEAPVWIQIHIVSAFVLIGIIPFTRFMHFLVAPIDYIWRKYQVVVWNWNRKKIRHTTRHNFGKKPRNH